MIAVRAGRAQAGVGVPEAIVIEQLSGDLKVGELSLDLEGVEEEAGKPVLGLGGKYP